MVHGSSGDWNFLDNWNDEQTKLFIASKAMLGFSRGNFGIAEFMHGLTVG